MAQLLGLGTSNSVLYKISREKLNCCCGDRYTKHGYPTGEWVAATGTALHWWLNNYKISCEKAFRKYSSGNENYTIHLPYCTNLLLDTCIKTAYDVSYFTVGKTNLLFCQFKKCRLLTLRWAQTGQHVGQHFDQHQLTPTFFKKLRNVGQQICKNMLKWQVGAVCGASQHVGQHWNLNWIDLLCEWLLLLFSWGCCLWYSSVHCFNAKTLIYPCHVWDIFQSLYLLYRLAMLLYNRVDKFGSSWKTHYRKTK